ncbi:hypothetical protein [Pyruvatibacter sp.]
MDEQAKAYLIAALLYGAARNALQAAECLAVGDTRGFSGHGQSSAQYLAALEDIMKGD